MLLYYNERTTQRANYFQVRMFVLRVIMMLSLRFEASKCNVGKWEFLSLYILITGIVKGR